MAKATISLDQADLIQVERILLDEDAQAALAFVRECVNPKIKATEHEHCKAWSDGEEKPY